MDSHPGKRGEWEVNSVCVCACYTVCVQILGVNTHAAYSVLWPFSLDEHMNTSKARGCCYGSRAWLSASSHPV